MSDSVTESSRRPDGVAVRSQELLREHQHRIYCHTDQMFARLMGAQWLFGVVLALVVSPRTWSGVYSQTHIHVWLALCLGGIISAFSVALALLYSGHTFTRHVIAVGQMLMSALLIHLTGGRIETHFHVFGSIAFLAFYRDWRVLISATVVVYVDHLLRGFYFPQSVYGVLTATVWRSLEHAGWVIFEVVFLVYSIRQSLSEMQGVAERQAQLENTNIIVERVVTERTGQLAEANVALKNEVNEGKKKAEDLRQANQELESFSYSVSHDLRAPLRHIDGFADMLRHDSSSTLSESGWGYLETMSRSAKQMGTLIDDLLVFSRMGRTKLSHTSVKMDELVAEVVREMSRDLQDRTVEWDIGPLPEVWVDRAMLKQVWVNLLSNAVKYTRNRERAEIKIQCSKTGQDELEFSVQDNGAGFDMQYAGKLFGVFQRLHHEEEFEGTGIGLANVQRIILRHGGRTRAEGEVDRGATFYFTLPVTKKNNL